MAEQRSGRFAIIPARAVDDTRFVDYDLRVLVVLGIYSDRDGWCWPSRNDIAQRARIDRGNVRQHLKRLAEFGYITIEHRLSRKGDHMGNRYRVLHDHILEAEFDALQGGGVGCVETPGVGSVATPGGVPGGTSYILDKRPTKKRENASTLPDDFMLTEERKSYAVSKGVTDVAHQWDQFRNYHLSRGSRMVVWDAAWRTWVGNAVKFAQERRPSEPASRYKSTSFTAEREYAERHKAKYQTERSENDGTILQAKAS